MTARTSKRVPAARDATHPIHVGARVAVLGFGFGGKPVLEGYGVVFSSAPGPHRYLVRFDGSPEWVLLERFVHPEYQRDPEAALAWMVEFWLAAGLPSLGDFFFTDFNQQTGGR